MALVAKAAPLAAVAVAWVLPASMAIQLMRLTGATLPSPATLRPTPRSRSTRLPRELRQPQAILAPRARRRPDVPAKTTNPAIEPGFVELPRQGITPGKQPSSRFRRLARWRVELAAAQGPESSRRVGAIPSVPRRPSLQRASRARPVRSLRRASGKTRSRRPWRQTATPRRRKPVPEVFATLERRATRAGCTNGLHRPRAPRSPQRSRCAGCAPVRALLRADAPTRSRCRRLQGATGRAERSPRCMD